MIEIVRGRGLLQQKGSVTAEVKQRVERFRDLAKYRKQDDTVPTADSLSSAVDGTKVLADDMWEIFRVMLH